MEISPVLSEIFFFFFFGECCNYSEINTLQNLSVSSWSSADSEMGSILPSCTYCWIHQLDCSGHWVIPTSGTYVQCYVKIRSTFHCIYFTASVLHTRWEVRKEFKGLLLLSSQAQLCLMHCNLSYSLISHHCPLQTEVVLQFWWAAQSQACSHFHY